MDAGDVRSQLEDHRKEIEQRMEDFHGLRDADDRRWFRELAFVLLSSQTDAREAWKAASKLDELDRLESDEEDIFDVVRRFEIQYARKKSEQLVETRKELSQPTLSSPSRDLEIRDRLPLSEPEKARKWMSDELPGVGLKGASHFLRNIGHGDELGVASRHTLSALSDLGRLDYERPPDSIERYRDVESEMAEIGDDLCVSTAAVDLVLWSMRTGEVFR